MNNSYKFFNNKDCKYFPCHIGIKDEDFNCLFCYCPLYSLGKNCGGNFSYVGKNNNVKSCLNCKIPHNPDSFEIITDKIVAELEKDE